jgi:hypothetical protein
MVNEDGGAERVILWIGSTSVHVDWLLFNAIHAADFWAEWKPMLFVQLDTETEWVRWHHHLSEALLARNMGLELSSHGSTVAVSSQGMPSAARLLLLPGTHRTPNRRLDGLTLFAEELMQATAWIEIIAEATRKLADELIQLPWTALIGPFPRWSTGHGNSRTTLAQSVEIGGMILEPFERCVIDRPYSHQYPSLSASPAVESWPVTVSGSATGFDRGHQRESATREIVLLCGVLSLATGLPWVVRELPFTFGDNRIYMADDWYGPTASDSVHGPEPIELPEWVDAAYCLAQENVDFRNALLMLSEGYQIDEPHPSLALVAYMSSLQSLGRIVEPRKNKQREQILSKVRDEKETTALLRYFQHRSETAHHGVLWGNEPSAHYQGPEINPFLPLDRPFWTILLHVREALVDAFLWIINNPPRLEPAQQRSAKSSPNRS